MDGSEGLDRIPGVADDQDRRHYAIIVRPQVFINLVPDRVIFHQMYPVAPDHTLVECDWLSLPHVVERGKDISNCERTQPAMSSKAYPRGGVLVPSEHHIGEFHTWLQNKIEVRSTH